MELKCTRPEWSNSINDFCFCDHPDFDEAMQYINPCEDFVWYCEVFWSEY